MSSQGGSPGGWRDDKQANQELDHQRRRLEEEELQNRRLEEANRQLREAVEEVRRQQAVLQQHQKDNQKK